ncbi:MAG: calcium/sodium antiporter [Candidatus Lokiarchaeota archaeon]|nr:calcium/sodium antiporter [Candidatus Lokiarchaeota archaeon]MBD3341825.1 calcium/sodium antiporter [Candidatus Lokiarchaeota archaeon]
MLLYIFGFLFLGFIGMYFGAKYVIISLENIAKRFGISQLLVGLTILSIGTSLPEIAVSVIGGIDKLTGIDPNVDGIVIGNKIGSFFTQITLVLGILGLSQSLFVSKWKLRREGIMLFISVFIFLFFALDGILTRIEGVIMILSYIGYLIFIIWSEKKIEKAQEKIRAFIAERDGIDLTEIKKAKPEGPLPSIRKNALIFTGGLAILLVAAEFTILSAHGLSEAFNISEYVVGILIVGFGTSLPELVADLTAIRRKSGDIAIGDILGSNICDILLATGSGVVIAEFRVPLIILYFDIPMLLIAIGLTYYFLWTDNTLSRWEAVFLISYYALYVFLKLSFFQA